MYPRGIIALFLYLVCVSLVAADETLLPAKPGLRELETRCLDARRKIQSGELHIRSHVFIAHSKKDYDQSLLIYFDGDRFRLDNVRPEFDDHGQEHGAVRTVHGQNCDYEGFQFTFRGIPGGKTPHFSASFMASEMAPPGVVINPRLIGYIPVESLNLCRHSFLELVGRFESAANYDVESVEDTPLLRVAFTELSGVSKTIWINPQQDYNIVKVRWDSRHKSRAGSSAYRNEVESRLGFFSENSTWFPVHVECRTLKDDVLTHQETCEIDVRSLDAPFESDPFCMSAMEVPIDTRVVKFELDAESKVAGNEGYWDGRSIVFEERPKTTGVVPGMRTNERLRLFLFSLPIVFISYFAYSGYRKRRSELAGTSGSSQAHQDNRK